MAALTIGNILVVSDQSDVTTGLAAEISAVDGSVVQTLSMPFSNKGAILPSGIFCLAVQVTDDDVLESFQIFSNTGTLVATVTDPLLTPGLDFNCPIYAWGDDTFYVLANLAAAGAPTLYTLSDSGVVGGQSWLLPANAAAALAIAVSADGGTLYYVDRNLDAIHRYDLVNDDALTDLIGGPSPFAWGDGLFFDPDENIVAMGIDDDNLDNVVVISPAGSVIAAYPFTDDNYDIAELFSDVDPAFIWLRTFPDDDGLTSTFRKVELATGTVAVSFTVDTLEGSGSVPETCPNLLLRSGGGGGGADGVIGPYLVFRMRVRVP